VDQDRAVIHRSSSCVRQYEQSGPVPRVWYRLPIKFEGKTVGIPANLESSEKWLFKQYVCCAQPHTWP